jgi:integral membrane protein (TIGR01906 family)
VQTIGGRLAALGIGLATAIVIVTAAVIPFLAPQWVAFEQQRAEAGAWTGFQPGDLRAATDAILVDLIVGGDFDVAIDGTPVLDERERAHMADVRTVFRGLWLLATISIVGLIVASRRPDRPATWRAVRAGSLVLTGAVIVLGIVSLVAFDQLFETFHEVFFPAGSYLFDPRTDRLVQLFPFRFWDETATVVGVVIIVMSLAVALVAGRRAARVAATEPTEPRLATQESTR